MAQTPYPQPVVVKDVEMSFGSMVIFMVKWTVASIPALIILVVVGAFAAGMVAAVAGGL